jgi:hypothetical protein
MDDTLGPAKVLCMQENIGWYIWINEFLASFMFFLAFIIIVHFKTGENRFSHYLKPLLIVLAFTQCRETTK